MANSPLDIIPREPLAPNVDMSPRWRRWFEQFQRMLGNRGGLPWSVVDKTGSSLTDLSTREHGQLQKVYGADTSNTGKVIESAEATKHITDAQAAKWDSLSSGGNAEVLHWFF